MNQELKSIKENKNIFAFQKMFIEKVLKSDGTVSFDTRVELQTAIKNIGDESITVAWNAFLSSADEVEGQARVKDLLFLLADKAYSN